MIISSSVVYFGTGANRIQDRLAGLKEKMPPVLNQEIEKPAGDNEEPATGTEQPSLAGEDTTNNSQKETNSQPQTQPQTGTGCANKQVIFTAEFTDLTKVGALGILGSVTCGSPGRSYISIKNKQEVPVYNPTDALLTNIIWADRGNGTPEYGLYFEASCDVAYLLDHIDRVTDKIKALAPKSPGQSSATQYGSAPNVQIKAGELLGYTDGTPQAGTFDFLVLNKTKQAFHINPSRWKWEQTIYADCPYDYYQGDLKTKHYNLLGNYDGGQLVKVDNCGNPSQDIAGTASGGWFLGNGNTESGKWLGVGQIFNWSEIVIRENGRPIFYVKDYNSKITPKQITDSNPVCFQGYQNTWAYLKLISADQLQMAYGDGTCPASFPSESGETWQR